MYFCIRFFKVNLDYEEINFVFNAFGRAIDINGSR